MNLFFAKNKQNELPSHEECEVGDLAMLTSGDVFCFMGNHWKMIGGRWVCPKIKQVFFNYIRSGWPDSKTISWDLDSMFDLSIFETVTDFEAEDSKSIASNPIWVKKFKEEITKVCKTLEEMSKSSAPYEV